MTRRKFSREFKIEAVKLVTERGVTVAQACRDLIWRRACCGGGCVKFDGPTPATAFPGNGQQRAELAEIAP
jgi:transposase